MFHSSGECSWLCKTRRVYIQLCNKMAALGYVNTLGKQTSSECHQRWVPRGSDTSTCPCVWLGFIEVLYQALEARKNLVEIIIIRGGGGRRRKEEEYEKTKRGNSDYNAFPSCELQVALGNIVVLSTLKKAFHGLYLFQFAIISLILPTHTNTLDRSCNFQSGTLGRSRMHLWLYKYYCS